MAVADVDQKRATKSKGIQKLLFIYVKRAYFYAPARRPVYVTLPDEDAKIGHCARLNVSMCGTRDAAANWEDQYASHLIANGLIQGKSSPCVFHQQMLGVEGRWNPLRGGSPPC